MNNSDVYLRARQALRENRAKDVIEFSEILIKSSHSPSRAPGYMMRGLAYEYGGSDLEIDLDRAIDCCRKASTIEPDSITFLHLARALMKTTDDRRRKALKYIEEAKSIRMEPEINIAYARYYEEGEEQDCLKSREYYRRAAFSRLHAGFFGYAKISRVMGHNFRADIVDFLRVLLIPFLFLMAGKKAARSF